MPSKRATQLVIGIDLGGTNMQAGVVNAANTIIGRSHCKTLAREGQPAVLNRITACAEAACVTAGVALDRISAVGIAAPGAIDIPRGIVLEAPNLGWRNVPLRSLLARKLSRPVVVDNDVNGAVWGEYQLGACRPRKAGARAASRPADVLGVWLGTGVGGGLVMNRQLFHGTLFTAGEVGQTVIDPHGAKGRRTVEDFCSRTGMSRTIRVLLSEYPKSSLRAAEDSRLRQVHSRELARAFRTRDPLAVRVVREAADLLGVALANWVTVLALDTVIIGGGVTEALGAPFIKLMRQSFERDVFPPRSRKARLVITRLMDDAGLLGAALLARANSRKA
jgi:glucokinase